MWSKKKKKEKVFLLRELCRFPHVLKQRGVPCVFKLALLVETFPVSVCSNGFLSEGLSTLVEKVTESLKTYTV